MSNNITHVDQLSVGSLYEMAVNNNTQCWVAWFEYSDDIRATDRPKDGSFVVYLGESMNGRPICRCYSFLSSEGKMYRVYNTDFVYGLKEAQ